MTTLPDNIKVSKVLLVGVVGAAITAAIVFFLEAMFYRMQDEMEERKSTGTNLDVAEQADREQRRRLENYWWVDEEKQQVAIPIDRAMALTVEEWSKE